VKINQALTLLPNIESPGKGAINTALKETNTSFSETLNRAIKDVNSLQSEAGKAVEQIISGQPVDLHDVMIAVEKAKTSFELLMEVRNKTLDMYREIMRMQV
jgi:flagellar hook-basal body complex protein FliE